MEKKKKIFTITKIDSLGLMFFKEITEFRSKNIHQTIFVLTK